MDFSVLCSIYITQLNCTINSLLPTTHNVETYLVNKVSGCRWRGLVWPVGAPIDRPHTLCRSINQSAIDPRGARSQSRRTVFNLKAVHIRKTPHGNAMWVVAAARPHDTASPASIRIAHASSHYFRRCRIQPSAILCRPQRGVICSARFTQWAHPSCMQAYLLHGYELSGYCHSLTSRPNKHSLSLTSMLIQNPILA